MQRPHRANGSDPRAIFDSTLAVWVRADYVTPNASATLDNMLDRVSSATASQATGTKKPTAVISNGQPAVRFDGSDDLVECTLGSSLSGRTWCFLVAKIVTLPTGTPNWIGAATSDGAAQQHLVPLRVTSSNFSAVITSSDGVDVIAGPARDTNVHLFESGYETSGSGRFVVDGVSYNGSFSGSVISGGSTAKVTLGAFIGPTGWLNVDIFEFGLVSGLPSTQQRLSLREYVRRRYGIAIA